ncbi:MAG: serine/threonine protein kinase [Oscillospiraceae bacterium]|nr:serine/threonine protein kinase [Oscillospiraceae bacterium]
MNVPELKAKFSSITKIKKGGQKIVYKAVTSTGQLVALKIIGNATDPRVLQEIDIVKGLSLSNVPQIIDSGIVTDDTINEDALYIVEQFIDGISLRDWLNAGNKANLSIAFKLLHTLLLIEITLEQYRILHRDINPNNIILGADNTVYLIDFGLAKKIGETSLTQTAALHGPFTPGYAPHEQFANMKMVQDVRTDLFQIGVTIYECCTGKNPFIKPNETIYQIMTRTMTILPPALVLKGDTKGMFSQFINMLMAKNQSQRPDTAVDAMRYLMAIKSTLELEE